jgi:hypothetical protein
MERKDHVVSTEYVYRELPHSLKRKVHPAPNTGNAVTAKTPIPGLRGMEMAGAAPVYLEMSVGIEMSVILLASVVPAALDPGLRHHTWATTTTLTMQKVG